MFPNVNFSIFTAIAYDRLTSFFVPPSITPQIERRPADVGYGAGLRPSLRLLPKGHNVVTTVTSVAAIGVAAKIIKQLLLPLPMLPTAAVRAPGNAGLSFSFDKSSCSEDPRR